MNSRVMKTLRFAEFGPPSVLRIEEVAIPETGVGEALVHVKAVGINPSDIVSVEGRFPNAVLPRVVGRDFAGKIIDGPADLLGTEVWGSGGDLGVTRDGTHAEYLALPREAVLR